jgi:NAD(P)-dependent dehydrogenase (short-subunit alcohol dehydrogenase family)
MSPQLKQVEDQVIVITGASSGIGLVTARMAAARGARVLLAARNESDLRRAVDAIRREGGRAAFVVADVSVAEEVDRIAAAAMAEYGRIDTWVNNAGVALYGRLMDLRIPDMRRQFDINYWGQVYGSRAAVPHLRRQGGALINVASALADRSIPLQGNYSAAKHALKAFTDSLRMELEEEGAPISVTLIKPGSIDTPLFDKARTLLGVEPQPVPPVYAPELVARAILASAERPVRDLVVSGMGKVLSLAGMVAPRLTDRFMERNTFDAQKTDQPVAPGRPDNLYEPVEHDGGERGRNWKGRVHPRSLQTTAALHPGAAAGVAAAVIVAAVAALAVQGRARGSRRPQYRRSHAW